MAGWGGKTDWRLNILANPQVHVQIGHETFNAIAESLSDREVAAMLIEAMETNPGSAKIWSRWAGEPVSLENPGSVARAVKYFPCFRLKPINDHVGSNQSA
jgi:hypothetical protein